MLAEHVQSNFLIFILKPIDNTCFLKQPLGCTQNNGYTRKPGVHPPALDLHHSANTSATDETPKKMATLFS